MPQPMQGQLGQMVPTNERAERLGQVIGQIRLTIRPSQHTARVLILLAEQQPVLALPPPFCVQYAHNLLQHVQQPGRGPVLCVLLDHLRTGHRAGTVHAQGFALKIHVLPAQTAHFLAAQAEIPGQIHDRLELIALDRVQKPSQRGDVIKLRFGPLELGRSTRSVGLRARTSCMTAMRSALRSRSWCLRAVLGDKPQSWHR